MFARITFDSSIMGGHACIRRMRIPVSVIVDQNVNISCLSYRRCDLSACEEGVRAKEESQLSDNPLSLEEGLISPAFSRQLRFNRYSE